MNSFKFLFVLLIFIFLSVTSYVVYRIFDQPIKLTEETQSYIEIVDVSFGQRTDCNYAYLHGLIRIFGRHGECRSDTVIPSMKQFIDYTLKQLELNDSRDYFIQSTHLAINQQFDMILMQDKGSDRNNFKSEFLKVNFSNK